MANLPSRIGRYEIQELIGTGGMGVLYRAIDPKIANRPVAIKVLRVDDEEMRLRFEREARMIGLLEHPNIVTVYDVGDHDGQPFIAMKFIPGDTLAERIERHPPMPLVERLVLIEQLCDGLAYAHGRGVIHRDIKPVNVMVHEGTGRLMILDFGIARASAQGTGITQIGKLVGTPRFMSPEQLQGNSIDHRSDIFSVGLVLYELLSCRPAFPGQEAPLVAYRVVHESPQSLAEIDPALPTRLTAIVDRAIAKSPAKRYQSLRKMHNDIAGVRQLLGSGEIESTIPVSPIPARPATTTVIALATVAAATGLFVANRFGVDQTDPRPPVDAVDAVPTVDVVDADPPVDVVDEVPTDSVADAVPADGVANPVPADDVVDTAPEGDTEQLTDAEADGAPRDQSGSAGRERCPATRSDGARVASVRRGGLGVPVGPGSRPLQPGGSRRAGGGERRRRRPPRAGQPAIGPCGDRIRPWRPDDDPGDVRRGLDGGA